MNLKFNFVYTADGVCKSASSSCNDFDLQITDKCGICKIVLVPNTPIKFSQFFAETEYNFVKESKFFANGFQSWTDTKEFSKEDKMADIGLVGNTLIGKMMGLKYVGDYTFSPQCTKAGLFHSHSFAYVRNHRDFDFFGSLNDKSGYTIIEADMSQNVIRFHKDLEGVTIDKPYEILSLFYKSGCYTQVFDDYFNALDVKPLKAEKLKGYTSWYNYYQNISDKLVTADLNAISKYSPYVNTFQIDDGYQTAVGDWLSIDKSKFPFGMKKIADDIHSKGLQAGLWLAPFGAQKNSELAKRHKNWLVCDEKGKPICVGGNWGGFYALDIYNSEVRSYLKRVFDEVLNVWGYDLVKLDFIYAAAIIPRNGKTRGEIAYDAIDLLRELVKSKKILACGSQIMPAFGKVEYMRIGADMALQWKHTKLRNAMHREDVSTPNAIYNSIYRHCLNGRAFLCDPDVFLLRRSNIKFTTEQQRLIAKFAFLFGSVLFTSDNVSQYDEEQVNIFKSVITDDSATLTSVHERGSDFFITYDQSGVMHKMAFNIQSGEISELS